MKTLVFKKKNIVSGIIAGIIGGVVLGLMMLKMEVMTDIGAMMGMPNAVSGFAFHLLFDAIFGLIFALVFYKLATDMFSSALWGGVYGVIWWFLGTLTLAKLLSGATVSWDAHARAASMQMLIGQVVFGVVLGLSYHWLRHRK